MCCGHRRARRGPIIVVLGKMAYDKYQERKAEKQAIARRSSSDPNYSTIEQSQLPFAANDEIVLRAGIDPPSYDDVVPSAPNYLTEKDDSPVKVKVDEDEDDLLDEAEFAAAQELFIQKWKARHGVVPAQGEQSRVQYESAWEQKKAAWLDHRQRKVERRAARRAGRG